MTRSSSTEICYHFDENLCGNGTAIQWFLVGNQPTDFNTLISVTVQVLWIWISLKMAFRTSVLKGLPAPFQQERTLLLFVWALGRLASVADELVLTQEEGAITSLIAPPVYHWARAYVYPYVA